MVLEVLILPSSLMRITDAILLAAGKSERMGQPKQLLDINGVPMIVHAIRTISACNKIRNLVVVVGHQAIRIQNLINRQKVIIAENSEWSQGMGSSLRAGLRKVLESVPAADDLLITVCDQPLMTASILENLIDNHQSGYITAAQYDQAIGTPAVFDRKFLPELLTVPDQSGAKKLFEKYPERLKKIPFPGGAFDLDTWEDYQNFISRKD